MFNLLEAFGSKREQVEAPVINPFKLKNIYHISMYCHERLFGKPGEFVFEGSVSFKCGNTEGEQKFKGENFIDLMQKMYNFCERLG